MARSSVAQPGPPQRLLRLASYLRALCLARPGLITKVLAIVAFFSIGIA